MKFISTSESFPKNNNVKNVLVKTITGRYLVTRYSTYNRFFKFDQYDEPEFWQSGGKTFKKASIVSWCYITED